MSSISSINMSGMQYAATQAPSAASTGSPADLAETVVKQAAASTNVQTSLNMIRADHDATQQLIDILA